MIRNIPAFGIDKDDLAKIFEESAKQWKEENKANWRLIKGVKIVKQKDTEKNAGYAFAEFFD